MFATAPVNSKRSGAVLSILNTGGAPYSSSGVRGLARATEERMSGIGDTKETEKSG